MSMIDAITGIHLSLRKDSLVVAIGDLITFDWLFCWMGPASWEKNHEVFVHSCKTMPNQRLYRRILEYPDPCCVDKPYVFEMFVKK